MLLYVSRQYHIEMCYLENALKNVTLRENYVGLSRYAVFEFLEKYGIFKALDLMIETHYRLFDTFSSKTKHNRLA